VVRVASLPDPVSAASCDSFSRLFGDLLFVFFRDMGSNDMVRAFGGTMGPTSTVSTRDIFVSQLVVGVMEVGRVIVAVIM
jgi:hypothetical protein